MSIEETKSRLKEGKIQISVVVSEEVEQQIREFGQEQSWSRSLAASKLIEEGLKVVKRKRK
jgi:hypothetical protein